ncbi:MAG: cobalamin-binding protein [Verrucomicrobia bacterium]|nr:cobalamin-binding protein [Verrucomicrobiota bacterium]
MKIVSLLPSATEIVYLLGLGDDLMADSHECDFPPEAARKPRITRSLIHNGMDSHEIDRLVSEQLHTKGTLYELDLDLWQRAAPDLILTQKLCDVCAISYDNVARAVTLLNPQPQVLTLEPQLIEDVFANILAIGAATQTSDKAREVVCEMEARVHSVRSRAPKTNTKVLCLEWLDPPFCAGHWLPQIVTYSGGYDGLGKLAEDSVRIEWQTIEQYDPEVIVVMCCGFGIPRTLEDIAKLADNEVWKNLCAVKSNRVFITDGNHYFSRPGPRLVDSLEIMAGILHPNIFPEFAEKNFLRL